MSKDKSSSTSIWDNFSEKIESLREALNTSIDENDSSGEVLKESDLISHFSDNNPVSLGTFDIEALREVLNTPIDDIIASGQLPEESKELFEITRNNAQGSGPSDDENRVVDEIVQSDIPELLTEIVEEYDNNHNNDSAKLTDTKDITGIDDFVDQDTHNPLTDESSEYDITQDNHDNEEVADTNNETGIDDVIDMDNQISQTAESDELDDIQDNNTIEDEPDSSNETYLDDFVDQDTQNPQTDESNELDVTQENFDIDEEVDTKNETGIDDFVNQDVQIPQIHEADKNDDEPVSHDVEIKIQTKQSIKNEKIDNYWKQGETPNPYIQKVDESREKLNKSLEMARELVNRQTEEPQKQEKKRFQFGFNRSEKNGNHKADTVKEKSSKKSNQFKPMVYEMLEPKQDTQTSQTVQPDQDYTDNQDSQAVQTNQTTQVKQDKGHKGKTKQTSDRAKADQEKEILNHRNRLEKSRSLGVPVFVKKPVNLEQIRQLKSTLTSQNDVRILVDTGSSQGRLLVISGQDPDTLLDTLSQLSIVKTTTVEDETINITV